MIDERYELREQLASDASGRLWRGWDTRLDRPVSVKVFESVPQKSTRWARFVREARILGGLDAPGLLSLYDVRTDAEVPYMVMAPIEGRCLSERLAEGPLPTELAWKVAFELLAAAQVAHERGFVHREIRPEHVFLRDGDEPRVKLLGFGRVRAAGETGTFSEFDSADAIPPHTAPELFLEEDIDPRTDVYGVAAVAYHAFTGRPPVVMQGVGNIAEALARIMSRPSVPPSTVRAQLAALDRPLIRALAKSPAERTPSLTDLRRELEEARDARTKRERPSGPVPGVREDVDGFEILGELGTGSMGTVFLAFDRNLERNVAIKFLHALSSRQKERFVEEARGMAAISHPNVVQIHSFGYRDDVPYLVMEHVPGRSVETALQSGIPVEDAVAILDQTAAGLEAVHQAGLTHGDVKPANVLIGPMFRVCVGDFGLARAREDVGEVRIAGSPAYMAPERLTRITPKLAHRADVYSLGVMAYELLSGRLPFTSESNDAMAVLTMHVAMPVEAPSQHGAPAAFDALVMHALEKDPENRLPSAAQFRVGLARAADAAFGAHATASLLLIGQDETLALESRRLLPEAKLAVVDSVGGALARLRSAPADAVLVQNDVEGGGLYVAAKIRAELASPPPILLVKGPKEHIDAQQLSALGVRAVLDRPIEPAALALNLKRLLRVTSSSS